MTEHIAKPFTLRDVLEHNRQSEVEVLNEINEGLVHLGDLDESVASIDKVLCKELLDREVMATWVAGNTYVIQVRGEEDAE